MSNSAIATDAALDDMRHRLDVAAGRRAADVVLRGGRIVNVLTSEIIEADIAIAGAHIAGLGRYDAAEVIDLRGQFVCPGFIDAHVHIESSLLTVPRYAAVVAPRGTAAVVIDPHEIANVLGMDGIQYMIDGAAHAPIDAYVMLSSCVPASQFESAAATLDAAALRRLIGHPRVLGLAEMMNYPGVVNGDADCLRKIMAVQRGRVDGHAPGLTGLSLNAYACTGIASDHECTTIDEAREKLRLGLHIMIREGSQARNLEALLPLITSESAGRFMFCTDDKDVDDLLTEGHIDHIVRKAIAGGLSPMHALRIASLSAADYFGLHDLGSIAPGRLASLAVLSDLKDCRVTCTFHRGKMVTAHAAPTADGAAARNTMHMAALHERGFQLKEIGPVATARARVMRVLEDRIDTIAFAADLPVRDGQVVADAAQDIAKIATIERHRGSGRIGIGFVQGFGLRRGALASSVGHDAHNLVVAGMDDQAMRAAAEHLAKIGGGLCVADGDRVVADVPLPIAGLMSDADAGTLRGQLRRLHQAAAALGCPLRKPFMAMSFLTLSVIGQLKVTDQGLVDVEQFKIVPPLY